MLISLNQGENRFFNGNYSTIMIDMVEDAQTTISFRLLESLQSREGTLSFFLNALTFLFQEIQKWLNRSEIALRNGYFYIIKKIATFYLLQPHSKYYQTL